MRRSELRDAEVKLASLEQTWPERRKDQEKYSGAAHDVMRIAENARTQAVERSAQARLANERRDNALTLGQAQNDADRAQNKADRAQNEADNANVRAATDRDAMTRAQIESAAARARAEQAQNETDKAKANEETARAGGGTRSS